MLNRILADMVVVIHFLWIVFMLWGFCYTFCAVGMVYILRSGAAVWHAFFDRWVLRTVHLAGIVYVGMLTILGKYCPLTLVENAFRRRHDPSATHPVSFIVHYIEKLGYPNVDPIIIIVPTIFIAAFTFGVFLVRPPAKIKAILSRGRNEDRRGPRRDDYGVS